MWEKAALEVAAAEEKTYAATIIVVVRRATQDALQQAAQDSHAARRMTAKLHAAIIVIPAARLKLTAPELHAAAQTCAARHAMPAQDAHPHPHLRAFLKMETVQPRVAVQGLNVLQLPALTRNAKNAFREL